MAVGNRRRVEAAVREAERFTGLQITVYLGAVGEDARAGAEQLFVESGSHARPAVLILVAPSVRRVEIVTAPTVRQRLTDEACVGVLRCMVERFERGDIEPGIVAGLEALAEVAGPGRPSGDGEELSDVLGFVDEGTSPPTTHSLTNTRRRRSSAAETD